MQVTKLTIAIVYQDTIAVYLVFVYLKKHTRHRNRSLQNKSGQYDG